MGAHILSAVVRTRLERIAGTLTHASKMPGPCSPSLPPAMCVTGAKLARIPGTPCHSCYAARIGKRRHSVEKAWRENWSRAVWAVAQWHGRIPWARCYVYALAALLRDDAVAMRESRVRWHVAGDLQNLTHLRVIVRVCRLTPELQHRLPTQEWSIIGKAERCGLMAVLPQNLNIQLSLPRVDAPQPIVRPYGLQVTGVSSTGAETCPASFKGGTGKCGPCDSCWDRKVPYVVYRLH